MSAVAGPSTARPYFWGIIIIGCDVGVRSRGRKVHLINGSAAVIMGDVPLPGTHTWRERERERERERS